MFLVIFTIINYNKFIKSTKENILITGVAGFIGFNLAKKFLKNNYKIYGIDNINNYYDPKLKNDRLKILKNNKYFFFKKIDLKQFKSLDNYIKKTKLIL